MIQKRDLKDLYYYIGVCRHSNVAKWSEKDNCFYYLRHKFGEIFSERINHPEDDDGHDLFLPYEEIPSNYDEEWKYDSRTASLLVEKEAEL